jgi:hypothetical protein
VTLAGSGFQTLLAVYTAGNTGAAVNDLTLVASNDYCLPDVQASPLTTSCATFAVVPGATYSVQVDGLGGETGIFDIAVTFAQPNDALVAAEYSLPATGTTLFATLEKGEPQAVPGRGASGSLWYQYYSESNGTAKVD